MLCGLTQILEKMPYNADPLMAQSWPKDIDRWDLRVREYETSKRYTKELGLLGGSYSDFAQGREPRSFCSASRVLVARHDRWCFLC